MSHFHSNALYACGKSLLVSTKQQSDTFHWRPIRPVHPVRSERTITVFRRVDHAWRRRPRRRRDAGAFNRTFARASISSEPSVWQIQRHSSRRLFFRRQLDNEYTDRKWVLSFEFEGYNNRETHLPCAVLYRTDRRRDTSWAQVGRRRDSLLVGRSWTSEKKKRTHCSDASFSVANVWGVNR